MGTHLQRYAHIYKLHSSNFDWGNSVDRRVLHDALAVANMNLSSDQREALFPEKKKQTKLKQNLARPTQAPEEEDLQPLSFDEQEALSESINLLPERLLPGAMQIIRESEIVNDDDDEIDLDIDQLDTKTQRKLQKFVMQVRLATMP